MLINSRYARSIILIIFVVLQVDFFAKGEGVDDLFFYFFPDDLFKGFGVKAELFPVAVFYIKCMEYFGLI